MMPSQGAMSTSIMTALSPWRPQSSAKMQKWARRSILALAFAEEHNRSLQQDQDESAPAFETSSTQAAHYVVKCNPCSSWGEHLCLTYEGKGKERKPVGNALPSGVQAIPGEGDCRMHKKSGFEFNYAKEVETGVKGRKYSTSTTEDPDGNLLPKERKSVIDMNKLKKIGFDPATHMEDPLFFLLPGCD